MTIARTTTALLAAGAVSVLLAACGGSGKDPSAASGKPDDQAMLAFAHCLREHGIDAPDPQTGAGGRVTQRIKVPKGIPPARMQQIQAGCQKKTGGGPKPPSKAEQAKFLDQALRFAKCMRAHGVDMPDPQANGGGILIQKGGGGGGPDPESPAFRSAQKACRSFLPGGKGGGPRLTQRGGGPSKGLDSATEGAG